MDAIRQVLDPTEGHMRCDVIVFGWMTYKQHGYIRNQSDILPSLSLCKNAKVQHYKGYFRKKAVCISIKETSCS